MYGLVCLVLCMKLINVKEGSLNGNSLNVFSSKWQASTLALSYLSVVIFRFVRISIAFPYVGVVFVMFFSGTK